MSRREVVAGVADRQELVTQLRARLCADLHLSELKATPEPLGFVWFSEGEDRRHLGVMFKVPVEDHIAKFLDDKELRTNGRGYNRSSSFKSVSELTGGELGAKG